MWPRWCLSLEGFSRPKKCVVSWSLTGLLFATDVQTQALYHIGHLFRFLCFSCVCQRAIPNTKVKTPKKMVISLFGCTWNYLSLVAAVWLIVEVSCGQKLSDLSALLIPQKDSRNCTYRLRETRGFDLFAICCYGPVSVKREKRCWKFARQWPILS